MRGLYRMKALQMSKKLYEKQKLTRTITLKSEKGNIITQQRNKMQDSNILKCKSESTKSDVTNGGSKIAEGWDLIRKEISSNRKR